MKAIDWEDPARGYREAAALLARFQPDTLNPYGEAGSRDIAMVYLVPDSTIVYDNGGEPFWMLQHKVRRATLEQLGTPQALRQALQANNLTPKTLLQEMIEAYIVGSPLPLHEQSLEQLTNTLQVVEWFEGLLDDLPPRAEVEQRIAVGRLLAPLNHLAGKWFRGRDRELSDLGDYVGITPPGASDDIPNVHPEPDLDSRPPLMIHGLGGLGKSSLISRFILDHVDGLPDHQRIPVAYLDFDRPGLIAEQPETLLMEAARQLAIQYPQVAAQCEKLRHDWAREIRETARLNDDFGYKSSVQAQMENIRVDILQLRVSFFSDFSQIVSQILDGTQKPYLFVLDTFEEVQYRSRDSVAELWRFLRGMQQQLPTLRTVLAGRATIEEIPTTPYLLEGLDEEASVGFLLARGVEDESIALAIARDLDGNPLSLHLAAQVVDKLRQEQGGALSQQDVHALLQDIAADHVQGYLYRRILEHIHDPMAREIAHPGLILRRLTPEIILKVLAEPCGLKIDTLDQANAIFMELQREAALVQFDASGALTHRRDVRQVMLVALREDEPVRVTKIHRRAIEYYQNFDDPLSRAEEIYHRMFMEPDFANIDTRWMDDVQPYLVNALSELPAWAQPELASRLHVEGFEIDWDRASAEAWQLRAEKRAMELVNRGRFTEAIDQLAQWPFKKAEYSLGSPLYLLEAQALAGLRRWDAARVVANRGISSTLKTDNVGLLIELYLLSSLASENTAHYPQSREMLAEARTLLRHSNDRRRQLEVEIRLLRQYRLEGVSDHPDLSPLRQSIAASFTNLQDFDLASYPRLLRDLALEMGRLDQKILARIIRLIGLGQPDINQQVQLLNAVAAWDIEAAAGGQPVKLDWPFIPDDIKGSLNDPTSRRETWGWLVEQNDSLRDLTFSSLLDSETVIPDAVSVALVGILQGSSQDRLYSSLL